MRYNLKDKLFNILSYFIICTKQISKINHGKIIYYLIIILIDFLYR